jgi:hypothetical protein
MSSLTHVEVEAVVFEIDRVPLDKDHCFDSHATAVAAIRALDKLRGPCMPVDKLKAQVADFVSRTPHAITLAGLLEVWLDRKGWLDG